MPITKQHTNTKFSHKLYILKKPQLKGNKQTKQQQQLIHMPIYESLRLSLKEITIIHSLVFHKQHRERITQTHRKRINTLFSYVV